MPAVFSKRLKVVLYTLPIVFSSLSIAKTEQLKQSKLFEQPLPLDFYQEALNHSERKTSDKTRDAGRKPAEVLQLLGVKPGMRVLDINSSEGYYAEALSYVVGESGSVIAHNDPTYMAFLQSDKHDARYKSHRLNNVEHYQSKTDELNLPQNSVDAATMMLAFHDYLYAHESRSNKIADTIAVAKSIYKALKPGAKIVVVDHVGQADGSLKTWHDIHRVSPSLVELTFKTAGFELVSNSDLLANKDDPLSVTPFDASVRGKTNRFVHVYQKR